MLVITYYEQINVYGAPIIRSHRQLHSDGRIRLRMVNFPSKRVLKISLRMKYWSLLCEGF
jgi:hypothetical protein